MRCAAVGKQVCMLAYPGCAQSRLDKLENQKLAPRLALLLPVHTGLLASMWSALRCGMRSSSKMQKGIMSKSCRSLAEHYSLWKLMLSMLATVVLSAIMAGTL